MGLDPKSIHDYIARRVGMRPLLAGLAVLLGGPRLEYLPPTWGVILPDYGVSIALNAALALAGVAAALCSAARATGLADLGRRVDLAECSVRRGEGNPSWRMRSGGTPRGSGSEGRPPSFF